MYIINLGDFFQEGSRVLTRYEYGTKCRNQTSLDGLNLSERVVVIAPKRLFAVSSSFIDGLFGKSIERLGGEEFRRLFVFKGNTKDVCFAVDYVIERYERKQMYGYSKSIR